MVWAVAKRGDSMSEAPRQKSTGNKYLKEHERQAQSIIK